MGMSEKAENLPVIIEKGRIFIVDHMLCNFFPLRTTFFLLGHENENGIGRRKRKVISKEKEDFIYENWMEDFNSDYELNNSFRFQFNFLEIQVASSYC